MTPGATPPNDLGLSLLVLRCQAGDEAAFGRLFEAFGPRTLRYLTGLVGDDAEDVQQEVWLTVYRAVATLANPRAFRTWLFSTTRRRAIDRLRRRRREQELLADAAVELPIEADQDDDSADLDRLDSMLARLAPIHREVLLLRYRDDLSLAEIALVVGRPVGTVKTRIHHAKQHLREILTGERS